MEITLTRRNVLSRPYYEIEDLKTHIYVGELRQMPWPRPFVRPSGGRTDGRKDGRTEGRKDGRAKGRKDGRAKGRTDGRSVG